MRESQRKPHHLEKSKSTQGEDEKTIENDWGSVTRNFKPGIVSIKKEEKIQLVHWPHC